MLPLYSYPALATILALLVYFMTFVNAGRARRKFGVKAPATTGNPDFERYYRVQINTLEQIVLFLPALWLFDLFWQAPCLAFVLGVVWVIGRVLYAYGYYAAPEKRGLGFAISALATVVLLLGALIGIIRALIG